MHTTLVIGATGILRPAVEALLTAGTNVIGVGRDPARFDLLRAACTDALGLLVEFPYDATARSFSSAVTELLDSQELVLRDVLAYAPATSTEVLRQVSKQGRIPTVEVVTSSAAEPREPAREWALSDLPARPWRRLVLGWRYDDGSAVWHDAAQISQAALDLRDGSGNHILGSVAPWSDRPV